jgi:hypothetical protein
MELIFVDGGEGEPLSKLAGLLLGCGSAGKIHQEGSLALPRLLA